MLEATDIQRNERNSDIVEITFADENLDDCLIIKMTVKNAQDRWHLIQESTNLVAQRAKTGIYANMR